MHLPKIDPVLPLAECFINKSCYSDECHEIIAETCVVSVPIIADGDARGT